MSESAGSGPLPISEALALRIGLAARAMPDVEPERLIQVLGATVGLPPTPVSLQTLTVRRLKEALDGALADVPTAEIKQALGFLRGETAIVEVADDVPMPEAYANGDMPGSIRAAVASNAAQSLDGHFGTCVRFLVYQVSPAEIRLIDVRRAENRRTGTADRNDLRAGQIADCDLVFVVSIGGPAAAKVVNCGVHPVKRPEGGEARAVLSELQQVLAAPPPWLAKAMGRGFRLAAWSGEGD